MSTPDAKGDEARSHGHRLVAVEGQFIDLVWECRDCGRKAGRTTARVWRTNDCE